MRFDDDFGRHMHCIDDTAYLVQNIGVIAGAQLAHIEHHVHFIDTVGHLRFVSIKDYVLFRLTGQRITDWSTASASGLLNTASHVWDDEALALSRITPDALAELVSTRHIVRSWCPDVSRQTGLPAAIPLIVGAGDAPLANIGVGAVRPGTLAVNIGNSAAARVLTDRPLADAEGRLWTYVADVGHWTTGGIIGGGGVVYEWLLRELLFGDHDWRPDDVFAAAEALAGSVPAGADGLLFVPYLTGEQSPGWRPEAHGLIYGMTLRHQRAHFVRAAIEGIVFALLRVAQPVEALRGEATEKVYVTGGLTGSPLWLQTIADIFGAAVVVPRSAESSASGAAIVGWLALGTAAGYSEFAQQETLIVPDEAIHAVYQERFAVFCALNERIHRA